MRIGAAPDAARAHPSGDESGTAGGDPVCAADEAPALIWATDAIGALVYANRRFETVFGIAAPALRDGGWGLILTPEALEEFRAGLSRCIARRTAFHAEVQVRTAGGQLRWHRCEATPKAGPLGQLTGYVGCNLDVTEGKEAEAALRELNATLERRVAERTAQLAAEAAARSAAQDRLRHTQKLEALGQLSGGVAHDFNNASAAVLAGIALLEKRHGAALAAAGPGASRLLAGLREAAERGAAISRRMLAFARREELRATEVDPTELLRNLRAVLANAIGPVVRVAVDAPAVLPALRVDRAQLETTLINLAVNARDAMPKGGTVTLGAAVEEVAGDPAGLAAPPVSLAPGQYVRLWVADTGIGMDTATLTRAAEPFFTTKPRDKGTGLGLSMADGFAAQSGGTMRIDSAPGRGTSVSLWLPCAVEQRAPDALRPAARGRVLIVDDQPMMRRFLAECLGHEGWEVQEAEDGGQALVYLDAGKPCDLLISDLTMPGMDGTALIQTARQRRPDLVAVLLTGTGQMADLAPMAERGLRPAAQAGLALRARRLPGRARSAGRAGQDGCQGRCKGRCMTPHRHSAAMMPWATDHPGRVPV
ncbi:response regulator [Dankookia sp. P2]|uniref:response regulator n=1 Tax=Dankookia sp. P2 TaxID=3423955 RepID=UPI003D671E18